MRSGGEVPLPEGGTVKGKSGLTSVEDRMAALDMENHTLRKFVHEIKSLLQLKGNITKNEIRNALARAGVE